MIDPNITAPAFVAMVIIAFVLAFFWSWLSQIAATILDIIGLCCEIVWYWTKAAWFEFVAGILRLVERALIMVGYFSDDFGVEMFEELMKEITAHSYRFRSERELQDCLEKVLRCVDVTFEREYRLSKSSRIDFLVIGSIGIEVKIKGSKAKLTRQIHRYTQFDEISSIIIVTTSARLASIPERINSKRVAVALLTDSCL